MPYLSSVFSSQHSSIFNVHLADTPWIIDLGAMNHIFCSSSLFTSITSKIHTCVRLPNGNSVMVTHVGIVILLNSFVLTNVLCVPSFHFNLILASQLTKTGTYYLIMLLGRCFIQDLSSWKMIGLSEDQFKFYEDFFISSIISCTSFLFYRSDFDTPRRLSGASDAPRRSHAKSMLFGVVWFI